MNQLSVKLQDALDTVGFEAALQKNGEHQFLYGTATKVVAVRPLDEVTVRVSATANGEVTMCDYDARVLERLPEDALLVVFNTVLAFA
jgi:hypothetical protein